MECKNFFQEKRGLNKEGQVGLYENTIRREGDGFLAPLFVTCRLFKEGSLYQKTKSPSAERF